jgi:hypothetical protein
MRLAFASPHIRRLLTLAAVATLLVVGGVQADRLGRYATLYHQKAGEYRDIERSLIEAELQWESMEKADREAAAKFRRGEWGRGNEKYKAEFEGLIKTVQGTGSEPLVNDLKKRFFASMAKTCDESADSTHRLAMRSGIRASHFKKLRQKYERAAEAPWWPVAPDPPEPK